MRIANKVLIFVAVYLVLFTVVQTASFIITGQEQTQLIESNFLVFGIEVGGLLAKRVMDKWLEKRKASKSADADDTDEIAEETENIE